MNTDTLLIGLSENADLKGEVTVRIVGYAAADCTGMETFDQEKTATITRGGEVAMLQFIVRGSAGDGGVDGGVDGGTDGGVDGGCNLSACPNAPGPCETTPAIGCAANGVCRFTTAVNTACGDGGACNSGGACVPACSVLGTGAACDDGLSCTPTSTCSSGVCTGTCPAAPECSFPVSPISCSTTDSTACALMPAPDEESCSSPQSGRCLSGTCKAWLPFIPRNFDGGVASVTYPTAAWTLGDGGTCDTVISTTGSVPTIVDAGCGAPDITSSVDGSGNAVLTMTGLTVAPNARLHFVGARPVQLVVLGDATVSGLVSVAPTVPGLAPAGSNSSACTPVQNGDAVSEGGGGGGFGGLGGNGGNSGGTGGAANSTTELPLRGGCAGGNGFRPSGQSAGGIGGGAIQIIVRGSLTVNGTIAASGGGGTAGTNDDEGAGGGGSGGMVLLEANSVNLTGGFVTANGGGGGEGGDTGETSQDGTMGLLSAATRAPGGNGSPSSGGTGGNGGAGMTSSGLNGGDDGSRGGGGGGGGSGVVFIWARTTCVKGNGVWSGHTPEIPNCN